MYDISQQPLEMQERYKELPRQITELFDYDTLGVTANEIAKEYGLNENQLAALKMEIELVLYLFMTREGFVERLQDSLEIEEGRAKGIAQRVMDDLFVIVEPILDFTDSERRKNEEITLQINNESAPLPPSDTPLPTAPENTIRSTPEPAVKPLRTFADDVGLSRAHGYGAFRSNENQDIGETGDTIHRSNQDDIIGK